MIANYEGPVYAFSSFIMHRIFLCILSVGFNLLSSELIDYLHWACRVKQASFCTT